MEEAPIVFGEDGLIRLAYIGSRTGKIKGPCTGHLYPVTNDYITWIFVDARDCEGLLKMRTETGAAMFTGQ